MKKLPIKTPHVDAAEAEARRFLARVAELRKALARHEPESWRRLSLDAADCPRENAAMKRASMDLTRALSALRKGGAA